MVPLINHKPKRLFAFGCSFTKYFWSTWPEMVADTLDVPFYNFGHSGAGNQYIANTLIQAHKRYNINADDLVMISWTNVCREDRWAKGNWLLTGNVYSQGIYDKTFVEKFADPVGYYMRDLATINYVKEFLDYKGCQYKFMSMCNIVERQDQGEDYNLIEDQYRDKYLAVIDLYRDVIDIIVPSFYDILWQDNIHQNKFAIERQELSPYWFDGHPTPIEHWKYLKTVFEFDRPSSYDDKMQIIQDNFVTYIKLLSDQYKKPFAIYDQPKEVLDEFRNRTLVKQAMYGKTF